MACLQSIASYNCLDGHNREDKDNEEVDILNNSLVVSEIDLFFH